MRTLLATSALAVTALTSIGRTSRAQSAGEMDHARHMSASSATTPIPAGQDAYATMAAIVRLLEADSTTDWSKVNIEALRQHLVVMNDVTLNARSRQTTVAGGASMDVTGEGRVTESIRMMLRNHSTMLVKEGPYRATVTDIPGGVRWVVTASDPADTRTAARIRGLGFGGLLTLGDHHTPHHLALARGEPMMHK